MQLSPSPGSGGGVGGLRANYLLPCCCILDSLKFDMQRDHVLKKLTFEPPPPPPPQGRGGWWGSGMWVCRQNICYHVAVFVILFDLICNITVL